VNIRHLLDETVPDYLDILHQCVGDRGYRRDTVPFTPVPNALHCQLWTESRLLIEES
jgi:hypothetical protein